MKEHSSKCASLIGNECDCDGYHTFKELYDHRTRLYISLCKVILSSNSHCQVWCSTKHSDGSVMDGWFILGISGVKGYQITYHLPSEYWKEVCELRGGESGHGDIVEVFEQAPEYDGHTSDDVLARLKKYF